MMTNAYYKHMIVDIYQGRTQRYTETVRGTDGKSGKYGEKTKANKESLGRTISSNYWQTLSEKRDGIYKALLYSYI